MTSSGAPIEIPGFTMGPVLGEGATSVVFRGERRGESFAIKVLLDKKQQQEDGASRFRREAAALARLNHPSLLKIYEVSEWQGRPYMVLELVEGDTLEARLRRGVLPERELVHVARSVAAALAEVHLRGIVHRDLKPANILLHAAGGVKIIDFGFAAERQAGQGDGLVVGTFLYSAPEQLGILKRSVDGRADLYALGAVLYECATGRRPIEIKTSTAEFLEKFLTVKPADAHALNPLLPPALSRMIDKLLAKDPDDRYQSCEGFLFDLDELHELDAALRAGRPLVLGRRDRQIGVWEAPLAGRDAELKTLTDAFAGLTHGRGGIVQVEGEGGSGKTRLIRELVRSAKKGNVVVITGKAQRLERAPFGALRDAIDDHIYRLQRDEDEAGLARVRAAARAGEGYLRRLSRPLERLLGEMSGPHSSDAAVEQTRFIEAVAYFFVNLANEYQAALLQIDDVQWLDEASVAVLGRLAEEIQDEPVLVATTARNDPESEKAREAFVAAAGDSMLARIALAPLDLDAIRSIVTAHLGTGELDPAAVRNLAERSRGNPFALVEYVRSFVDTGVLRLEQGRWGLDEKRLRDARPSADVVDLVVGRIGQLSDEVGRLLGTASVIGFEFDIGLLARVSQLKSDDIFRSLDEVVRAGLVEVEDTVARFVHDRVHEAFTRRLGDAERQNIHQLVAVALDAQNESSPSAVFALARHYAAGHVDKNPQRVYETSLKAGLLALSTFSNAAAYDLLERALTFAERTGLGGAALATVHESFGVACVRTGRHVDARAHYDKAAAVASEEDRSRLQFLGGQAFASEGKNDLAWETIQLALDMEGAGLPRSRLLQHITLAAFKMLNRVLAATGFGFGRAKGKAKRRRRLISEMHDAAKILTYFLGDQLAVSQVAQRELFNTHFLGVSPQGAKAHAFQTMIAGLSADMKAVEHHGRLALAMAEQVGDPEALARSRLLYGYGLEFAGANVKSQALMRSIFGDVVKHCTASDVGTLILHLGHSLTFQGRARDAVLWCEEKLELLVLTGGITSQAGVNGILYSELMLVGRTPEALEARRRQLALTARVPNVKHARAMVACHAMMALLDTEDLGDELEQAAQDFLALRIEDYHRRFGYALVAYTRLAQAERAAAAAPGPAREAAVDALRVATGEVRRRAICPVHLCHALVFEAALERYAGRLAAARATLERAELEADAAESTWGRWVIYREKARVARALGNQRRMRDEAHIALRVATDEGWRARGEQIRKEFGITDAPRALEESGSHSSSSPGVLSRTRYLDGVFRVSLASAGSIDPLAQAKAALDELIKLLGAERGAVFVTSQQKGADERLSLLAARSVEQDDIEMTGYSNTVVERVRGERKPMILTGNEDGEVLGSESIAAHHLRSIIACPLQLHDELLGVVYLDSRVAKGLFHAEQLDVLTAICNHIAIAMESARVARAETERRGYQKDLELTAAVQNFFLPRAMSLDTDGFSLTSFYRPAGHCSGDWLWYDADADSAQLILADVTGHGAPSAMLTAFLASYYRAVRKHNAKFEGAAILEELHDGWSEIAGGSYMAATIAMQLDLKTRDLTWWMAGAPPFMILRADGTVDVVTGRSDHIGAAALNLSTGTRRLGARDRVFAFTDGCYEIDIAAGRQLGLGGLRRILGGTRTMPTGDAVHAIWTAIDGRMKKTPQAAADDITFAVFDVLR